MDTNQQNSQATEITLRRELTLPLLTLYGLGVTIGAGIYVLVGAAAAKAGLYTPFSFLLAALIVSFTGLSYAELGTYFPVSAGEAAYVRHGLNSRSLSLVVGLMIVATGTISAAAVSIGAAGYMSQLIALPPEILIICLVLILGVAAAWGIVESVVVASVFTLIEIVGLCFVVWYAMSSKPDLTAGLADLIPPFELQAVSGIVSAGLLAFFAFVGFEDIANVAEEVKQPKKTLPRAIILTLLITTILYLAVTAVTVLAVPMDKLAGSPAPLALIFQGTGIASTAFIVIASLATINGVLVQIIMASRVLYGLGKLHGLESPLTYLHPKTRTPLIATALIGVLVLGLALLFPIGGLAELTSMIVLGVFMMVNLALLRLKWTGRAPQGDYFRTPLWVPALGFLTAALMLLSGFIVDA